jgi:phospholipid-binding lipoprotein MlaA
MSCSAFAVQANTEETKQSTTANNKNTEQTVQPATADNKNTEQTAQPNAAGDTQPGTANTENTAELAEANTANNDPYEHFNRAMFQFNEVVDRLVLKPVATLYIKIIPKPLSKGLSNFYYNIDTIPTVANDFLQANFYQGTSDAWRLAINSTIGIGGFFDVASDMGLEPNKEDLGLTFAQWGYRNSNYLVLPFLGPGTVRDQVAWPINYLFLTIYPHIYPVTERNELYLTSLVVKRAELLRYQNVLSEASLDDYTFIRDAYMQRRTYQLERNAELNNPYLEKNDKSEENSQSSEEKVS